MLDAGLSVLGDRYKTRDAIYDTSPEHRRKMQRVQTIFAFLASRKATDDER
jgi:hypothetical protein